MQILLLELNEMSVAEIRSLDGRLDALFNKMGIDVVFSKHFKERLQGREKDIEPKEIYNAFVKFLKSYGKRVYTAKNLDGILKDLSDDINIPFSIKMKGNNKNMYAITVMRKKDFKSYSGDEEFKV